MPWLRHAHTAEEEAAWLVGTALPGARVWVAADDDGRPAGFLARERDLIAHLYLRPDRWRQGIGSALIAAARADSPPRLRLFVFQRNLAARAFYEHHGFRAVRFGDGRTNMEAEPDALYEWTAESAMREPPR
jgi:GNAT superfamily N-acetyltransferase